MIYVGEFIVAVNLFFDDPPNLLLAVANGLRQFWISLSTPRVFRDSGDSKP